MAWDSVEKMLREAELSGHSLPEFLLERDCAESGQTLESARTEMERVFEVMLETSGEYSPADHSGSGLSGGDAEKYHNAFVHGNLLGGEYLSAVTEEALKFGECNACMKRIVAAPTAGSCGVLPAVLLPLYAVGEVTKEMAYQALFVAGGFGEVIASRATLSGAAGGCQAEVGAASAMAAAALTFLRGGSGDACAHAAAMALGNLLGLVCDPVAGLVEIPCIKRNVVGAVNAISAANMALAGLISRIPCDEVIDAMGTIGAQMSSDLRETGIGGLAGTPTGKQIAANQPHKMTP